MMRTYHGFAITPNVPIRSLVEILETISPACQAITVRFGKVSRM